MKFEEFSRKSKTDLEKIIREKRKELRSLRFDLSSGKVKNVRSIQKTRKDIARILTVLKKKHE